MLTWDWLLFDWIYSPTPAFWLLWVAKILSSPVFGWTLAAIALLTAVLLRSPHWFKVLLLIGISVGATDALCGHFFKPVLARLRPCYLKPVQVFSDTGCGNPYGLPSNHAANASSVATILALTWGRRWGCPAVILALLVGWSRIRLGVHFPGDVLLGFLVGLAISTITFLLANRKWRPGSL
jgi:undecaprenyl-diphosphatase